MKRLKILIPIVLAAMLFAVVVCALVACGDLYNYHHTYDNEALYTVASSGNAGVSGISEIDVDWYNGAIYVQSGESGSELTFTEVAEGDELTSDTTMHYLIDGTTLRIKYAKSGKLTVGKLVKYLYVTVPSDMYLSDIDIDNISADITIRDVSSREIDIDSVSGAINLKCYANSVSVDTVSGDVYTECNANSVEIDSVSGKATVVCTSTPYSLEIDTVSGDVLLRLSGDIGFTLEYDTISGLFTNAFSADTRDVGDKHVYLDGTCNYEVDTESGKLTIEKLQ